MRAFGYRARRASARATATCEDRGEALTRHGTTRKRITARVAFTFLGCPNGCGDLVQRVPAGCGRFEAQRSAARPCAVPELGNVALLRGGSSAGRPLVSGHRQPAPTAPLLWGAVAHAAPGIAWGGRGSRARLRGDRA